MEETRPTIAQYGNAGVVHSTKYLQMDNNHKNVQWLLNILKERMCPILRNITVYLVL